MPILSLAERLERYNKLGFIAGKFFMLVAVVDFLIYCFFEWWAPRKVRDVPVFFVFCLKNKMLV